MEMIAKGAEAELYLIQRDGRELVLKRRIKKGYRNDVLDEKLRGARIANEARLLAGARGVGVRSPIIYDIDLENNEMALEYLDGPRLKDVLGNSSTAKVRILSFAIKGK